MSGVTEGQVYVAVDGLFVSDENVGCGILFRVDELLISNMACVRMLHVPVEWRTYWNVGGSYVWSREKVERTSWPLTF